MRSKLSTQHIDSEAFDVGYKEKLLYIWLTHETSNLRYHAHTCFISRDSPLRFNSGC